MANYRDSAVVLRTLRLGEADRIVTMMTSEHGKVRAVAKGVRKVKSHIGARLEPLTHVDLLCWRGRELDIVTQVEVLDVFKCTRGDLGRLEAAMTMIEVIDQSTVDHQHAPDLYTMLVGALRALDATGAPVILGAFCQKLLAIEGVGLVTDRCVACGGDSPLVVFEAREGGFLCRRCRRGQSVSEAVVELAQQITSGGLGRAIEEATGPVVDTYERLMTGAIEHHLDRRLRTTRHHLAEAQQPA